MHEAINITVYESSFMLPYRDEYAIHQLVWSLITNKKNDKKERDFVYRVDRVGDNAVVKVRTRDNRSAKQIEAIQHDHTLTAGMPLLFDLRCAPEYREKGRVVRVPKDDDAIEWLNARAERCGFEITEVEYSLSEPLVFRGKGNRRITLNNTVIKGTLSVVDTKKFSDTLANGIGRHKGYGFGLLIIKKEKA